MTSRRARSAPRISPRQLRRRRAASWRCEPLGDASRDPWDPAYREDWTDSEVTAWQATAEHLRAHGLYGRWQLPDSVRVAWYRRRTCPCGRGAA